MRLSSVTNLPEKLVRPLFQTNHPEERVGLSYVTNQPEEWCARSSVTNQPEELVCPLLLINQPNDLVRQSSVTNRSEECARSVLRDQPEVEIKAGSDPFIDPKVLGYQIKWTVCTEGSLPHQVLHTAQTCPVGGLRSSQCMSREAGLTWCISLHKSALADCKVRSPPP